MADQGNAVNARYVGPSGLQLWDGTRLNPGDIVLDVGFDEANGSDYWEPVAKLPRGIEAVSDASRNRTDISFGNETGGGNSGRPELDPVLQPPEPEPKPEPEKVTA